MAMRGRSRTPREPMPILAGRGRTARGSPHHPFQHGFSRRATVCDNHDMSCLCARLPGFSAVVLSISAVARGGSTGDGLPHAGICSQSFTACGGDPTGTWDIVSLCSDVDLKSVIGGNGTQACEHMTEREIFRRLAHSDDAAEAALTDAPGVSDNIPLHGETHEGGTHSEAAGAVDREHPGGGPGHSPG